ncbi:MAG: hypothetical protein JW733_02120 [Coriobacteriia bacterium]|nr:hypothetical protein [Coriobacteriia bacterium]MBN2840273.1 hypothetical protein [Coriobacteriia bacterium]
MKKTVLVVLAVAVLGVGAYFGASALAAGSGGTGAQGGAATGADADPNQPDRVAEVKGLVVSIDGTQVSIDRYIKNPSEELTDEEKAAKKAERAQLSQEERQALKAAENAALETERVTVTIPVGVPIVQMVPQGDTPVVEAVTLADIRSGMEVTVWTDGGTDGSNAEYVKLAGVK